MAMDIRSSIPLLKHPEKCDCERCTAVQKKIIDDLTSGDVKTRICSVVMANAQMALFEAVRDAINNHPTGSCEEIYGKLIPDIQQGVAGGVMAMMVNLGTFLTKSDYARANTILDFQAEMEKVSAEAVKMYLRKMHLQSHSVSHMLSSLLDLNTEEDTEATEELDTKGMTH